MFGHDDDQNSNMPGPMPDITSSAPMATDLVASATPGGMPDDTAGNYVVTPAIVATDNQPIAPISDDVAAAPPANEAATPPSAVRTTNSDELMSLKQQALQQLSPLMDQLDQTPEERFRTTMMMIQASDNDSLIRNAYDAALSIPDEKARAQALLDVINEINYFTQQDSASASPTA